MKKLLLIIISLLIIFVFAAQLDDDLSSEAKTLIDRIETPHESEAYIYLTGIYASANDSPEIVGRKLFDEYRKQQLDDSYEVIEYPSSNKIPVPDGALFCRAWEQGCLETLFTTKLDSEKLNEEYLLQITRANQFHAFKEYKTLTKPSIIEPLPPYQYLSAVERIKILNAISDFQKGNAEAAIAALLKQFSNVRKALELQDNLIGKVIFLMRLSEIIDVSSIIIANAQNTIAVDYISSLSESEKSFYSVSAREFAMAYYTFKSLDKNPEFFETGGHFPGWITLMIYKPNMSINAVAPIYIRLEYLASLAPGEFAQTLQHDSNLIPQSSTLRNYVGNILIGMSPNFDEYVSRFMDLDAKLVLFNQHYHFKKKLTEIENPYYDAEYPEVSEDKACFRGPIEDKKFIRCIQTKI